MKNLMAVARETKKITKEGRYELNGRVIPFPEVDLKAVKVITPEPIVSTSKVASAMSALTVVAMATAEKSSAEPPDGATPPPQFAPLDMLPSPAAPVQRLAGTEPTVRTSLLPTTLQAAGSPPVEKLNFSPIAAVTPLFARIT